MLQDNTKICAENTLLYSVGLFHYFCSPSVPNLLAKGSCSPLTYIWTKTWNLRRGPGAHLCTPTPRPPFPPQLSFCTKAKQIRRQIPFYARTAIPPLLLSLPASLQMSSNPSRRGETTPKLTHSRADPHSVTRNPFPSAAWEQRATTANCEAIPATEGNAESLKKKKKKAFIWRMFWWAVFFFGLFFLPCFCATLYGNATKFPSTFKARCFPVACCVAGYAALQ